MVEEAYPKPPEPEPPVRTDKTVTGRETSMVILDDPAYLLAHEKWEEVDVPEWDAMVAEETDRRGVLFVFKDLQVPEDWDIEAEVGAIVRMDDPDWQPTPGELGRKRDYIQWELFADQEDVMMVQATLMELIGIPPERVKSFMDSFLNQMAGEAPQ
jgi:hypothetical protein